jgi:hypothetical protein
MLPYPKRAPGDYASRRREQSPVLMERLRRQRGAPERQFLGSRRRLKESVGEDGSIGRPPPVIRVKTPIRAIAIWITLAPIGTKR